MRTSDRAIAPPEHSAICGGCGSEVETNLWFVKTVERCSDCPPRYYFNILLGTLSGDSGQWFLDEYCEQWLEDARLDLLPEIAQLAEPLRSVAYEIRINLVDRLLADPLRDWLTNEPVGSVPDLDAQLNVLAAALGKMLVDRNPVAADQDVSYIGQRQKLGGHHD